MAKMQMVVDSLNFFAYKCRVKIIVIKRLAVTAFWFSLQNVFCTISHKIKLEKNRLKTGRNGGSLIKVPSVLSVIRIFSSFVTTQYLYVIHIMTSNDLR